MANGTAQALIDVARGYLGTTEDDPRFYELIQYYNDNTGGYDMRLWDEWCACFVSVCSLKSGNADATGTSVNCKEFRDIWHAKGIYREAWEVPGPGWLIDYDWERDGVPDHIGIVVECDGETIHVIEGNTDGETCAEHWIPVGSLSISCFGAPVYSSPHQEPGEPANDFGFRYRAHAQDLGWCDWVRDGQTAGTEGFALRMEGLQIDPPEGWELSVSVHLEGRGWTHYNRIAHGNKLVIGSTGEERRIEAIKIDVLKAPAGMTLQYRVHSQDYGWKAWTEAGYTTGSDGLALRLEAIQIKAVER